MKPTRLAVLAGLLVALVATVVLPQQLPDIDRASVERVIRVLADDDMEGRSAFSPAAMRAAEFIASEFEAIGLQPMPGDDGYLQRFEATPRRRGGRRGGGDADQQQPEPEPYPRANVV
ncbi:MAG: hypothetical protein PVJ51_00640, partial [Acidobacteriota bacterium]